ncbi:MAG: alpha/beta hydrolase, partial [Acidimicrobiales bacterium]
MLASAEPFSAAGGPDGALVLHGFTGSPQSVRGLAQAFAAAGFAVESPCLPGHGTVIDDLLHRRWDDWLGAVEQAYLRLADRCARVVLAGQSTGGSLACRVAVAHPEVAGLAVVNPFIDPPAPGLRDLLRTALAQGFDCIPGGVGPDVADPDAVESGYHALPVLAALSLFEGLDDLVPRLGAIACPTLIFTSVNDHVVPPVSSDILARAVAGPVERVRLERSYH